MSTSLFYKLVPKEETFLPDELKHALRKRNDGYVKRQRINLHEDRDFLEGLVCAGVKGAEELLAALEENGELEIFEQ